MTIINGFKTNNHADSSGTSHHKVTVMVVGRKLIELLGPGRGGDLYKVYAQWVFEDQSGAMITLYDWKLFDSDEEAEAGYCGNELITLNLGHFPENKSKALGLALELERLCK